MQISGTALQISVEWGKSQLFSSVARKEQRREGRGELESNRYNAIDLGGAGQISLDLIRSEKRAREGGKGRIGE